MSMHVLSMNSKGEHDWRKITGEIEEVSMGDDDESWDSEEDEESTDMYGNGTIL